MSKSKIVVLKALPGFQPGHLRVGGRTKRTAAAARSLADELGVDPLAYLLNLLAVDATEELEFAADGTERRVKLPVSRELKIDISKSLAGFFYPKLNAQQITGPNEGPIEVARANTELERALATPEGVEAVQKLALLMAAQDAPPAPTGILPPGDIYRDR
jgi:predicted RecB family endonuclease